MPWDIPMSVLWKDKLLCGCFAGYIKYPPALLSSVLKLINPPLKDLTQGQMKAAVRKVKG